ncbi:unnamed protein product [Coffea canephora]|uniref:Uncharacterized protein n=1 Tax=Coffea canephora TaxID=49390 RepID=A0A068VCY7_COFCA|nr:unnamed protein product [Coffea canephora]
MDGEELQRSIIAAIGELSRYKTYLKKTGRADTLIPEVTTFDGKKFCYCSILSVMF